MAYATSSRRNKANSKPSKKAVGCNVCGGDDGKYKCPKCRLPYCSVKCCKEHKETCSLIHGEIKNTKENGNSKQIDSKTPFSSKYLSADELTRDPLKNAVRRRNMLDEDDEDLEDEGWRVTKEMMESLDQSEWLRKELVDGGLRQIIAEIDAADDEAGEQNNRQKKRPKLGAMPEPSPREVALMKARHANSKFSKFIDRMLVTAGVLIEGDKTVEQELSSILIGDEQIGMVALAPVVKNRRKTIETSSDLGSDSDDNNSAS
eukprot:scaffold3990_cov284-Chaetoceros_neogracile.AAC.13